MGNNEMWVPPFGTYFEHRTGMLWAEWVSSNGANGVEPPAFVMSMMDDINAFQSATPGSAESAEIGARMAATMTENLLYIGTVLATSPIYRRNELQNFSEFQRQVFELAKVPPCLLVLVVCHVSC